MNTKNLLAIWAKRVLPFVALAAGLLWGCDKPKEDPYAGPMDPAKVLKFGEYWSFDSISYDNVMKYAKDPRITTIIYFLDSTNNNNSFVGFPKEGVTYLRNTLQERLDYTPKATGAGTFEFRAGRASVEDSLWFIANGWKIRPR